MKGGQMIVGCGRWEGPTEPNLDQKMNNMKTSGKAQGRKKIHMMYSVWSGKEMGEPGVNNDVAQNDRPIGER
jgi:hypothetical protein